MVKRLGIIAITVTILIALYFIVTFGLITQTTGSSSNTSSINLPSEDTTFGNLFFSAYIPDSLPYAKYKIVADIQNAYIQKKEQINNGRALSGFSFSNLGLKSGFAETKNYDELSANFSTKNILERLALKETINNLLAKEKNRDTIFKLQKKIDSITEYLQFHSFNVISEQRTNKEYYFSIGKYELKDYDTKFFIKNSTYNLAKVKWQQNKNNPNNKIGKYYIDKINFRYSSTDKEILIPLNAKTYKFLEILLISLIVIAGIAIIYFYVGIPIQILINISRGDPFSVININYLNVIIKFTIGLTLFLLIIPRLLGFILVKDFYKDFTESNTDTVLNVLKSIFMIVGLILIRKAFIKGKNLQHENELTV